MSLAYIRDHYGVPAEAGGRVKFHWYTPAVEGTIIGAEDQHLVVQFDGDNRTSTVHPTWKLSYKEQS